ncbi:MAG: HD domain-containing protein [Clostridia bacterium]|nr:HD domain-containing protein [Clostridia bacterium]
MHQLDNKLKFWLLFALAFPTIMIIFFGGLLLNSLGSFSSISPYLLYAGIVLFGFADIILTYSMFAMIQDRLRQSYMKIRNWTQKIKEGDLSTRLTFSKKSDLYYIAESFNTMADVMQSLLNENANKVEELNQKNEMLAETNKDLVSSLVSAIEAKDKYTLGHSQRVSDYAVSLAKKLNMSKEQINEIRIAGMLHDVGKIGISDEILHKPAKLSKDEYEEVKKHPSIGSFILNTLDLSDTTMEAINYHHERYDGKGYPLGLSGKELSLEAQIIALSDAYDAMTSDRPYRKAMTHEEAISEIKRCSDTQFNPELVSLIEQGGLGSVSSEVLN